mgnify:CR=1 FL=1
MPDIFLTPASVSYLTQFILSLAITTFLLNRLRSQRVLSLLLVTILFALITLLTGLLVMNAAFLPFYRLLTAYAENTVLALAMVALILFAYRFPERYPQHKWEMRILLALSLAFLVWEAGFMVYRYDSLLNDGNVFNRFPLAAYSQPVVMLFAPLAFLRQTLAADPRPAPWWRKLWNPKGKGAQGARNLALVFVIPFVLGFTGVFIRFGLLFTVYNAVVSIGILLMLWLFANIYINFIPGSVNVASRLSIIALTLFLALLGTLGWLIAPAYAATFRPALRDHQTLRFTPNASGGYEVSEVDFHFESALGEKVRPQTLDENGNQRVAFTFPFYGETYTEVYVHHSGIISLGQTFRPLNLEAAAARVPNLFPLRVKLTPDPAEADSGLYIRQEPGRLIITWNRLLASQPGARYTFQAILYADGIFDFTYNGLPQPILFSLDASAPANLWLRGVVAGHGEPLHELPAGAEAGVDLISLSRAGASPLLENQMLAFRGYLHTFMEPVAWVVIGGSLFLLVIIPLLLRSSIARPLEALTSGVQRMESGEMDITIPVQTEDEIGFLTGAFNAMSNALDDHVRNLEMRVSDRTADLQTANDALRKLSVAVEQSPSVIVITNPQAEIEYVNAEFTLSTGYLFDEVKGKNPRLLQSGQTPPETYREMWSTLLAGKTWRGELINRRKNGETYWEYVVIAPIYDAEGKLTHYVGVKEDITARKVAEAKLEALAVTDPMTGLLNRRGFFPQAQTVYARCQHPPDELAVLMMDIDYFKNINDQYGHQAGDVVLQEVAARIRDNLRPTDLLARYGGEEFAAILPRTSQDTLQKIADRLNAVIREQPFKYKQHIITVTISIGGAMLTAATRSLDDLLSQADQAMYQAKAAGRDCVVIFDQSDSDTFSL